jgi:hypothetical protein
VFDYATSSSAMANRGAEPRLTGSHYFVRFLVREIVPTNAFSNGHNTVG